MSLHQIHSDQYGIPCAVPGRRTSAQTLIDYCREIGAVRHDDGEEFCVKLRSDVGPELWTESALRRSLPTGV